jgi:hypothetical protein
MTTRLKKEKGYRVGGITQDGARILRLIRLPHLGVGRHQILTDRDYVRQDKVVLDSEFSKTSLKTGIL